MAILSCLLPRNRSWWWRFRGDVGLCDWCAVLVSENFLTLPGTQMSTCRLPFLHILAVAHGDKPSEYLFSAALNHWLRVCTDCTVCLLNVHTCIPNINSSGASFVSILKALYHWLRVYFMVLHPSNYYTNKHTHTYNTVGGDILIHTCLDKCKFIWALKR